MKLNPEITKHLRIIIKLCCSILNQFSLKVARMNKNFSLCGERCIFWMQKWGILGRDHIPLVCFSGFFIKHHLWFTQSLCPFLEIVNILGQAE